MQVWVPSKTVHSENSSMAIHIQNIFISAVFKKDSVCRLTTLYNQYVAYNTKESMLWNYKTFHFSPKMRQMMYPDCKTTPNTKWPLRVQSGNNPLRLNHAIITQFLINIRFFTWGTRGPPGGQNFACPPQLTAVPAFWPEPVPLTEFCPQKFHLSFLSILIDYF